jgi:hypothetical protein
MAYCCVRVCCMWGHGCFLWVYVCLSFGGRVLWISGIYLVLMASRWTCSWWYVWKIKNIYYIDVIFVYVFLGSYNCLYVLTYLTLTGYFVVLYWSAFLWVFWSKLLFLGFIFNLVVILLSYMEVFSWVCYKLEGRGFESHWGHWIFQLTKPSSRTMALGSTQPVTEMSARNLPGGKRRPACKADNLTTICEPIV